MSDIRPAATILVAGAIMLFASAVHAETYTYDAAGRLTAVTYDDGTFIEYSYDANGNRLARTVTVNAGAGSEGQQDGGGNGGERKSGGGGSLGIAALAMLLIVTGLAWLRRVRGRDIRPRPKST